MNKNSKQSGFTLIEIMIVVAIIAILAAVAIPQFINYRDKAYCSAAETDARTVAAAVANYFSVGDRGNVPDISELGLPFLANQNIALVEGSVANEMVIVKIVTNNRCPGAYQNAMLQTNPNGTGWDGHGVYYHVIGR